MGFGFRRDGHGWTSRKQQKDLGFGSSRDDTGGRLVEDGGNEVKQKESRQLEVKQRRAGFKSSCLTKQQHRCPKQLLNGLWQQQRSRSRSRSRSSRGSWSLFVEEVGGSSGEHGMVVGGATIRVEEKKQRP